MKFHFLHGAEWRTMSCATEPNRLNVQRPHSLRRPFCSADETLWRNRLNEVRRSMRRIHAQKRDWAIDDLHERFVDVVKKLGGPNKATAKKILELMKNKPKDLTYEQVKRHLEMYRNRQTKLGTEPSGSNKVALPRYGQSPQGAPATNHGQAQPKSEVQKMMEAQEEIETGFEMLERTTEGMMRLILLHKERFPERFN